MCCFLFYWLLDEILENDERLLLVDMMLCDGGVGLKVFGLLGINLWLSKNWLRKAKCRDTWIGIGTMILEADMFADVFGEALEAESEDEVKWHVPVFILFHLARRFWNQILTCTSLRPSLLASSDLSFKVKYFFDWNSSSNSCNWNVEKAVLRLRLLFDFPPSASVRYEKIGDFLVIFAHEILGYFRTQNAYSISLL